ncbi:tyrosine-type recombinase/integrase [Aquimarina algiphila]|uniref:tyrosine-type recombinase/integrase n=1 Tax=Aquimarina algiphila TaxID=2047982 RepID=UPI002490424F|nr:tyrosine-type recombinase/integrase [Aquimarina algiphila]
MYFYLKEPKSNKETLIIIQYYIKSEKKIFKYSTGEKIHPEDWNFEERTPKSKRGSAGVQLKKVSSNISHFNNLLEKLIDNYKINGEEITREKLKIDFDKHFKKDKEVTNKKFLYLTDFIDDFVIKAPDLINRTTKRKNSPKKIKQYKRAGNRLKEFERHIGSRIKMDEFNLDRYDQFVSYLSDNQKYSTNNIGDLIKNIKVLLKRAEDFGYSVHQDCKKTEFAVLQEESISIALTEKEIQQIYDHDFSDNEKLQNVRDLAIIGLWTGLRVSDFLALPKIKVTDKFIEVQPKKTKNSSGVKVVIPLHHHIKGIIEQRGMPRMISDVKFNLYIKDVCEEVEIKELVKGGLMNPKTKRKEIGMYPKFKLISSHTCRRSFATNLYKMNFPTLSIMNITGHTSERSFLKYIKVTPREHAEKLLEHWDRYYGNNK